jgi:hypothetical protein
VAEGVPFQEDAFALRGFQHHMDGELGHAILANALDVRSAGQQRAAKAFAREDAARHGYDPAGSAGGQAGIDRCGYGGFGEKRGEKLSMGCLISQEVGRVM